METMPRQPKTGKYGPSYRVEDAKDAIFPRIPGARMEIHFDRMSCLQLALPKQLGLHIGEAKSNKLIALIL
jgi:hypothetical protein